MDLECCQCWPNSPELLRKNDWRHLRRHIWNSKRFKKNQKKNQNVIYYGLCTFMIKTQNMTNPTIVSPIKMEYGWNFNISGLKMMVKIGLENIFLKFLHSITIFYQGNFTSYIGRRSFGQKYTLSNKNDIVS